jgi:hypothetical protein
MNEKRKEKLKDTLVKARLMTPEDTILECLQANYLERLAGRIGQWKQGWIYFTEEKILYPTGILDSDIVIPYDSIRKIEKCSQGIFPMGIAVTWQDPESGEWVTDKFSLSKRNQWIQFLTEKAENLSE